MKIAVVSLRFDAPGGVERTVLEETRRLLRAGEEVRAYASDLYDESTWDRRPEMARSVDGVSVDRFPVYKRLIPGLTMPLMPGLIGALREAHPDIIHAHSHRYGHVLQAAAVSHRTRIPLVVSTHYHPADRREPPLKRGLLRVQDHLFGVTAYHGAAAIVVETRKEAALVGEFAPRDRIRVIPPGIDLEEWRLPDPEVALPALPGAYVLYAGRIAANKGLPGLIEALARIPAPERPTVVLLGPDWGQRTYLARLATQRGVEASLRWLGSVEDRAQYRAILRRARLLILPSEWEAFGMVLLEAMAAGVPTLATAVGGVPEVLADGRAGVLVPYGDPDAMAAALLRLWTDPEERRRLVDAGKARVAEFTWDRSVQRLLDLFREVVNSGTARAGIGRAA